MSTFYDSLRGSFGPLKQNQVDGIEALLKATDGLPPRHRAYVLATSWHETGPASSSLHMTPRREMWGPTEAQRRYEGRADLGNTVAGDGKRFLGRGYVQITGRTNYDKASRLVGKDLVANPDLALDPEIAAKIIVHGMTNGWFTGRRMSDFANYRDMRRVVNGTDKAELIAGYADAFEKAIRTLPAKPVGPSAPSPLPPPPPPTPESPPPPSPVPPSVSHNAMAWLVGMILAVLAALAAFLTKEIP